VAKSTSEAGVLGNAIAIAATSLTAKYWEKKKIMRRKLDHKEANQVRLSISLPCSMQQ